jgi:hypothetical protein
MGINSIGLVTDLTAEDVLKFKNYPAISSDDVILIHQFLEEKQILKN